MAVPQIDNVSVTPNKTLWQPGEGFVVEVQASDPDQGTTPAPLEIVVTDPQNNEARHTLPFVLSGEGPLGFALLDINGAGYTLTPRVGSPGVWDCVAP